MCVRPLTNSKQDKETTQNFNKHITRRSKKKKQKKHRTLTNSWQDVARIQKLKKHKA